MISLRLLQLRYFILVAKTENVSRSARILHISQPSLSRALADLEKELNVELFVRNGHSLKLNENGLIFQQYIQSALNIIDDSVNRIKKNSSENKNKITLRFETSSPLIPGIINYLHQKNPKTKVELVQNGVESNTLEHYDFEFSTHKIYGNINELLMTEEIMLAVNHNNPISQNNIIAAEEIPNHPIILTTPSPLRTIIESFFKKHNLLLIPSFVTGDRYTISGLVSENIGVSFVPAFSWNHTNQEKIKLLHISPNLERKIYLSYPKSSNLTDSNKLIIQSIKEYFAKKTY